MENLEREAATAASAAAKPAPRVANPPAASTPNAAAARPSDPGAASVARSAPSGLVSDIEPRTFGLTLGDVFTQRIPLPEGIGALAHSSTELRAGRIGTWFERRGVRRHRDDPGREWLHIEHQVINVPAAHQTVNVPPFSLSFQTDKRLDIAAVSLSIGPMTPSEPVTVEGTLSSMRADRPPTVPSVALWAQRMRWALAALVTMLLAWLAWRLGCEWRDARAMPFARALRQVQSAARQGAPEQSANAWVAVHHAFNAAAARSVHAASLSVLFERQPALMAERAAIERFFAVSNARFFRQDANPESFDLLGLVKRMRQLERQSA